MRNKISCARPIIAIFISEIFKFVILSLSTCCTSTFLEMLLVGLSFQTPWTPLGFLIPCENSAFFFVLPQWNFMLLCVIPMEFPPYLPIPCRNSTILNLRLLWNFRVLRSNTPLEIPLFSTEKIQKFSEKAHSGL